MLPEHKKIKIKPIISSNMKLSPIQIEYLKLIKQGEFSISTLLEFCYKTNEPISFIELWHLLIKLERENSILEPRPSDWQNTNFDEKISMIVNNHHASHERVQPEELKSLPFFKSFSIPILECLSESSSVEKYEQGYILCKQNESDRTLFVILEGQASIYKKIDGEQYLIGRCERGSVIGEVGFFTSEKRTANIILTMPSKVIKIKYSEKLNLNIKTENFSKVQERLFFLQAILKSEMLRNLRDTTINSLLMMSESVNYFENEVIFNQGDDGDSIYIIINGSVKVTQNSNTIAVLSAGNSFGEIAFLIKDQKRTATVRAQSACQLMRIPYGRLLDLTFNNLMIGVILEKQALGRIQKDRTRVA